MPEERKNDKSADDVVSREKYNEIVETHNSLAAEKKKLEEELKSLRSIKESE